MDADEMAFAEENDVFETAAGAAMIGEFLEEGSLGAEAVVDGGIGEGAIGASAQEEIALRGMRRGATCRRG